MDLDLAQRAVDYALNLGARYAEARIQNDWEHTFIVKNGNIEAGAITKYMGISIRVLVSGALGFTATNSQEWNAIRECIEESVRQAKASSKLMKKPIEFSQEKPIEKTCIIKPKKSFQSVDVSEKTEMLLDLDRIVRQQENKVKIPMRLFFLRELSTIKYYVNSDGTRYHSEIPRLSIYYYLTAMLNGDTEQYFQQLGESRGYEAMKEWKPTEIVENTSKMLVKVLTEAKPYPKGKLDFVLGPSVTGLIAHESCGHPYEADRILGREAAQAGESFVKPEMLGSKIGSEIVTVVEDPTLPNSFGFYLVDDEGVPARRRELIKNGLINEFLHNRATATTLNINSNGAARAEFYNREPLIRMANTYFEPGDYSLEELIEDIKIGIYMKNYTEWNIDDRRYNMKYVGCESYLIEGGEIKHLVRRPPLEITTPKFYEKVDAIGDDLAFEAAICGKGDPAQGVPVWIGGPHLRIRSVRVS